MSDQLNQQGYEGHRCLQVGGEKTALSKDDAVSTKAGDAIYFVVWRPQHSLLVLAVKQHLFASCTREDKPPQSL